MCWFDLDDIINEIINSKIINYIYGFIFLLACISFIQVAYESYTKDNSIYCIISLMLVLLMLYYIFKYTNRYMH